MSRTYLCYVECKGLTPDDVAGFFVKWCGFSQVWKFAPEFSDGEYEYVIYCEMGCSSGIHPEETMFALKEQLEELGLHDIEIKAWSLHPDKAMYIDDETSE